MPISRKQLSDCPIERCVSVLGGRWKTMIVYLLLKEPLGFGQLRRKLAECPERVLTRQLRELERDGVIGRTDLGGKPPRVEYALTPLGGRLASVFQALWTWGENHKQAYPATTPLKAPGSPKRALKVA